LYCYVEIWNIENERLRSFFRVYLFTQIIFKYSGIYKEIHRKVPSIAVLPKNTLDLKNCSFKGDTTNDAYTTGVLLLKSDANIFNCQFAHHKSGSIMCDLNP